MNIKYLITICVSVAFIILSIAQKTIVLAKVMEMATNEAVVDVNVFIENTNLAQTTDVNGKFIFSGDRLPLGEGVLVLSKTGFETQYLPIVINEGRELDL